MKTNQERKTMYTQEHPIAIVGAMQSEVKLLLEAMEERVEKQSCGMVFHSGKLDGKPVVVMECGIGKVNAARCVQAVIDNFAPGAVINTGIAGGIGNGLHVGDVVVSQSLVMHDFDLSPLGNYVRGALPGSVNTMEPTYIKADDAIREALVAAANAVVPGRGVRSGVIVSGDVFVSGKELKQELASRYHADAAEMEGAAVAQVAQLSGVPFAVLRVVSDLADGTAPESFATFELETASLSSKIVRKFLQMV